jgi:hypothetical protein
MAYLPPLNGGRLNATISGNTAGAGALVSSGTLTLAGGNNITLSQAGNAITISGGAGGGAAISAAGGSFSSGTAVFSNSNNVSFGANASTITASASFSQTIQTQNMVSFGGSTGNIIVSNANNITFGALNSTITASASFNQTNQTMGMYGLGNTTQNSSTTLDARNFSLNGLGAMTVGYSAGSVQLSAPVVSSISATGALSISNNGNTVSIGVPAFSIGISSTLGNTAGTTGTVSNQLIFAGGNNITLSQSTGVGGNTITIVGGAGGGGGIALANSQTTYTSGTANLNVAGGAMTIQSTTGQSFNFSVPATSSLSATGILSILTNGSTVSIGAPAFSIGISSNSTVTNQMILTAGNNITLSQSTNAAGATVTVSAASQTNQTVGFSAGVNTSLTSSGTFDARNMYLNGLGAATVGFSASSLFVSAPTQTVQTQSRFNLALSGNSTSAGGGYIQVSSGVMTLAGGNNITLSQNGNAVTILGGAGGGNATFSAGTASAGLASLVFSNSNGVSFGLNGSTITASAAGGGGGGVALSNSNSLISSGTANLSVTGGAMTISGTGQTFNFSVPQTSSIAATGALSVVTNVNTISFGAPLNGTLSNWEPLALQYGSLSQTVKGNASMYFYKLQPEAYVSASRLLQLVSMSVSSSSNSSHAGVISIGAGIYTANGASMSLITQSSGSTYYQWSNTSSNSFSVLTGLQGLSLPINVYMAPGNYWLGLWSRTSSTNANWFTASNVIFTNANSSYQGLLLQASNATQGVQEGVGLYSTTVAGIPSSAAFSQITQSAFRTNAVPYMVFKNMTW